MKLKRQKRNARRSNFSSARKWFGFAGALLAVERGTNLFANPQGMVVVTGSGSAAANGSTLNVTVGQNTLLNWSSFNIQPGEITRFVQPSSDSIVLNNIGGASPSQIWGTLNANGTVILANAYGFSFGPNSMIKVGGSFIATTAPITPDFGVGSTWQFTGMPPQASIVNYGTVEVGHGKSLFLIAEQIENHGTLSAPGGNIGFYVGKQVLVSDRADGRGLSATVQMPSGSVDNFGRVTADAGTIAIQAQVVNQNGILQADSVQNKNGVIELIAGDALNLGANSQILARGDDSASGSKGGTVTLKSKNNFSDTSTSQSNTTDGVHGGNGGNMEVSANNFLSLDSSMDARAQSGWTGGRLLLDPANITLAVNTVWNLSQSTGINAGQLTLQAGGDIIFNSGAQIVDVNNWSVNLQAGVSFPSGNIQSGVGNILLNGGAGQTLNGSIQTAQGSISLNAGNSILVGTGFVRTLGGWEHQRPRAHW